jgi:UDP-N-acetylmuramyl pentapeptide phosphotransferase/UDP-N-acetylglucosamine-1-phosphate transferase
MDFWLLCNFVVFVLCVLFAGIFIPQILLVAFKKRLFDLPNRRKIHKGIVPRLGGIAFTPVIVFTLSMLIGIGTLLGDSRLQDICYANTLPLSMGFCALFLIYIVGLGDDLVGVQYRAKFIVQALCAIFIIMGGLWVKSFHGLIWINDLNCWVGCAVTLLFVIFVCNAINLIDGIDGLASGLSASAFIIYGIVYYLLGEHIYSLISFASLGVLVPFFYYNVFGDSVKRRKIFMGDTGSLTIGLLLSFLSLNMLNTPAFEVNGLKCSPFVIALAPLIVPCFDVVRVYIGRVQRGCNPFLPDRTHIHHKMLELGVPSRVAMVTIVGVALLFSMTNILLSGILDVTLLMVLDIVFWCAANVALSRGIKARKKRLAAKQSE